MQVTLITCTFNSENTINDCCNSILLQTHKNIEHIIVDNNSQDKTINFVKRSKIQNQRIIYQKSNGLYAALNEGLKASNGNIIGVLHSDDTFNNENVIKKISDIFKNNEVDAVFSNLFYTRKNNQNSIIRKWNSNLNEGIQSRENIISKIKNGWMLPHTTLFIKKSVIRQIGIYNENYKISSDYDFILRLLKKDNLRIYFLNDYTIKMRLGGVSNKNLKNIIIKLKEDYQIMKYNSLNPLKTIFFKNISKIKQFF